MEVKSEHKFDLVHRQNLSTHDTLSSRRKTGKLRRYVQILIFIISLGARAIRTMCRRRADLVLENLALRQQVTALKKEQRRPPLRDIDRGLLGGATQSWPVGRSVSCYRQGRYGRWMGVEIDSAGIGPKFPTDRAASRGTPRFVS